MNNISFLTKVSQIKGKHSEVCASLTSMLVGLAYPLAAHAELLDSAKNSGSKIYTLFMSFALIVAMIAFSVAWIKHATGSRKGVQEGNEGIVKASLTIGGVMLTGMIFGWLYATFTAAGGGLGFAWPF